MERVGISPLGDLVSAGGTRALSCSVVRVSARLPGEVTGAPGIAREACRAGESAEGTVRRRAGRKDLD